MKLQQWIVSVPAVTSKSMPAKFEGSSTSTPSYDSRGIVFCPCFAVDWILNDDNKSRVVDRFANKVDMSSTVELQDAADSSARLPSLVSPHELFFFQIHHVTLTVESGKYVSLSFLFRVVHSHSFATSLS